METTDPYRFRTWLLGQMQMREWTHQDLATRAGLSRSLITKWVRPTTSPSFRRPSYRACRQLAIALGVPLDTVLVEAGLAMPVGQTTPLQEMTITAIRLIPDDVLIVVYHQIIHLVDSYVQAAIRQGKAEVSSLDGDDGDEVEEVVPLVNAR